jgi:hypothetical protein
MTLGPIGRFLLRYAESALYLHEFTAFLAVKDNSRDAITRLKGLLSTQDAGQHTLPVGVHSLRWILFQPERHNNESPDPDSPHALVLSFVLDGELEDVLGEVAKLPLILDVLPYCPGYTDGVDAAAYLLQRRVKSGYMFRDLGPLSETDPPGYELDATRAEIEDAMRVRRRFENFYARHSRFPRSSGSLRQRFLATFRDEVFPFELMPFERLVPDEHRLTRRISELIQRIQARQARNHGGVVRRGAHAKGHGFLKGKIRIDDRIPDAFAEGLFKARGRTFDLVARASNSKPGVNPDRSGDVRGLAFSVRIPIADGGDFEADDFLRLPHEGSGIAAQDFVLFSHPRFFAANLRDALTIFGILSVKSLSGTALRLLAFFIATATWRRATIFIRSVTRWLVHPLAAKFHSATPYMLGDRFVTHYSVEPSHPEQFAAFKRGTDPNYLAQALKDSLDRPIELDLYVHPVSLSRWAPAITTLTNIIEDASADWNVLSPPKIHVATISFDPKQDPDPNTPRAEHWAFNPWNALEAHRPLGNMNRGRLRIMDDSLRQRSVPVATGAPVAVAVSAQVQPAAAMPGTAAAPAASAQPLGDGTAEASSATAS